MWPWWSCSFYSKNNFRFMSSAKAAYPQLKLNVTCNLVDDEKNQSRKRLLYDWIQTLDAV